MVKHFRAFLIKKIMATTMRIPTEFTAIDRFSAVINKMAGSVKGFSKSSMAAIERFNTKASQVAPQMAMAGASIIAPLGLAIKSFNSFEKSMSNVSTLVDTNVEDMGKMGDSVLKMATRLPVPIEDLTTSLYSIRSAGISADNAMAALETSGKLAVAGLSTTAESTDILTSAMNAFSAEGKSSQELANILFKTVKDGKTDISQLAVGFGDVAPAAVAAGVKMSELSAATAALTLGGMKTASAQTKLKSLFDETTRTTGKLSDAYKKLGGGNIATETKSKGFMAVLEKLKNSVGGNEVAFKNLFSSQEAGAAALTLMGTGNKAYTNSLKGMEGGTDSLTGAFEKQLKGGANQAQLAENNMKALSITVGSTLAPTLNDLIQQLIPFINSFKEFAINNPNVIKGIALLGGVLLIGAGAIKGINLAMSIGSGIMSAYTLVTAAYEAVALTAALTGASFAAVIWATVWPILAIIAVILAIVAIFYYWDEIVAWFGKQWESFTNMIGELWDGLVSWFEGFSFADFFMNIGQSIINFMLMPLKSVLELLAMLPGAVGNAAQMGLDKLNQMSDLSVLLGTENQQVQSPEVVNAQNQQNNKVGGNIDINVKDKGNNVDFTKNNSYGFIPVNLTATQGF